MVELLTPTVAERLKVCQEEVRKFADERDDMLAVREMARVATASIVPEIQAWRDSAIQLTTGMVRYAMDRRSGHNHEIEADPFRLQGILAGGSLYETISVIDSMAILESEYDLCLRLAPEISGDQGELALAESVLVPVSSLVEDVTRVD